MSQREDIEQLAARWISRADAPGWNAHDQAALDAWLDESTSHRVAWLRLHSIWRRADRLAAVATPDRTIRYERSAARRRTWIAALAASLIFATIGGVAWYRSMPARATYTTGVGGHQTVPLGDGSRLELNTRTELRTQIDVATREVWLDRGEAYFDVAHDPSRPFVVHAGNRRVTVLGTKFSVRRDGDNLEVAVVEGKVQVDGASASKAAPPSVVNGGDILFGKSSGTLVAVRASDKVARDLSWRQGILIFDQSTLADAAAEFNRYNRTQLVIGDARTADIRIGGSFDASGVDAFVRLLERGFNLKAEKDGEEIVLSQR